MPTATDPETGQTPRATDGDPHRNGRPIDEHAGDEPTGQEDDGQLFVVEHGRKVHLGNLIPRGVSVEHAFVFAKSRRKGAGQLLDFNDDVLIVMRGKVGSVKPVAKRDDQENVKSVTIETQINPKVVVMADSEEGMQLLRAVFEKRGIDLP